MNQDHVVHELGEKARAWHEHDPSVELCIQGNRNRGPPLYKGVQDFKTLRNAS